MEKKSVIPPSKFMQFCLSMQGMNAIDKKNKVVLKFLLFWHYGYRTVKEVSLGFELIYRPKNN